MNKIISLTVVAAFCALAAHAKAEGTPTDPGCEACMQSSAFLKWTSICNEGLVQAACYCAAATVTKCHLDNGGCGSDVATLRKMVERYSQQAAELGTDCFR